MEFIENAVVNNAERRLVFPQIHWLNKKKFEDYLKLDKPIQPYLEINDETQRINYNRIYIGKSIPDAEDNVYNVEDLGTVLRSLDTGEWELHIPHVNSVIHTKTDFLVLNIENSNTFYWHKTSGNIIPKYALRGSIDSLTNDFYYVGRTVIEQLNEANENEINVTYFTRYGWDKFDQKIPNRFGKVHLTHDCLYAPFNKLELKFHNYEILCLTSSPNELKILARDKVRSMAHYSNSKLDLINKNSNGHIYAPNVLLSNILKYPSYLTTGEYLLRNEKIVRADDKFELIILANGKLVVRSTPQNSQKFERIISKSVDSIWCQNYQVIIFYTNMYKEQKVILFRSFLSEIMDYKLMINEQEKPHLVFRTNGRDIISNGYERDELEKHYLDSNYHNISHLASDSD